MAKVTLADRLKIKMPAQPQQASKPQSSVPAPGAPNPQVPKPPKPAAAGAAKVPGVNAKQDGDNSAETFNNTPTAPKNGRPMKDPKQPLMKALNDAQKHKIMTEVNQNLGVRNLASNDPALKQTGLEQQTKYGKPGDAPPPMPTAVTQIKKPLKLVSPTSENKTKVERKRGDETAPLSVSSVQTAPVTHSKTPTGTDVLVDPNATGTPGAMPSPNKSFHKPLAVTPDRKAEMKRINTALGYNHLKSPDEHRQALGRHLLSQASVGDKIDYHSQRLLGVLRGKLRKHEEELVSLKKTDAPKPLLYDAKGGVAVPADKPQEPKKKKKNKYEPKTKVTQAYSAPGTFHAGKFLMGVLGHGSPVANRVLSAAKQAVTKSYLENEWESLSKSQADQHVKLLKQINEGSIDAPGLVALFKKD